MYKTLSLFLTCILLFTLGCGMSTAFAESSYSNVLDDLKKDTGFRIEDYPVVINDYSLSLIQIAETTDNRLLVYVYQPSGILHASHIRFSITIGNDLALKDYSLTLLNFSGTLFKYVVNEFDVSSDTVRYYEIVCLFRQWDSSLDQKQPDWNENNVDYVSFNVGKRYMVTTVDNNVVYACTEIETIEIIDPYVGYIRYPGGYVFYTSDCDSYYIAFDTDKPIDRLLEADVYFVSNSYMEMVQWNVLAGSLQNTYSYTGDDTENFVTLTYTDKSDFEGGGLWGCKYTWDRISSVEDFIKTENLTSETEQNISDKQWVLRFADYPFVFSGRWDWEYTVSGTVVRNVSILRLKFETDGKVYNLGAVSNVISPGENQDPDNNTGIDWRLWFEQTWQKICDIFGVLPWWAWVIIAVVVIAIVSALVKPVANFMWLLLQFVWWIVSAPFRLVVWIVQTVRNKRQ